MSSLAFGENPEENPFADPFARPRSPDPWTSFRAPEPESEPEPKQSDEDEVTHSAPGSRPEPEPPSPIEPLTPKNEDPLESQILREPSPPPPPGRRAPFAAYREPTPPPTEPSNDGDKTPKRDATPTQSPAPSHSTHSQASTAPEPKPKPASPSPQREASPPPQQETQSTPVTPHIQTPLDSPLPPSTYTAGWGSSEQNQFASLSLGGETPGLNWKPPEPNLEESTFVNGESKDDDDTGDDEPLANQQARAKRASGTIQPVFELAVEDPQKVGDPVRGYTMYTVHTKTTSPLFSKASFSVLRRFSDFLWLYDTLSANNPGVVVPPVPEKNPFGRFQDTFIEQRRLGLQQCIQKIANHPILSKDPDLKFFLESDNFALEIKHRSAVTDRGAGGLMASIGSSIVGTKFFEADEWFDQKKIYFDSLENQLRGLAKAIDIVTKSRQEVSIALGEFSDTMAELSASDLSKTMIVGLATLAEVERKSKELQDIQARQETVLLINTVDEYIRLIASVRLAFAARIRIHATWQAADNDVRRLKANQDRARRQGKLPNDRIAQSLAEVQEVERRAMEAKREFDHVSRLIKTEVSRFEKERVDDFKKSLESLLNGMVARQREIIHSWEHYQEMLLRKPAPQQVHPPPEHQEEVHLVNDGIEESDTNPFAS